VATVASRGCGSDQALRKSQALPPGASFGQWRAPWSHDERRDSVEVLDFITRQAWSNGQARCRPQEWGVDCVHFLVSALHACHAAAARRSAPVRRWLPQYLRSV